MALLVSNARSRRLVVTGAQPLNDILPWANSWFLCGGNNLGTPGTFIDESFKAWTLTTNSGAYNEAGAAKFGAGGARCAASNDNVSATVDPHDIDLGDFLIGSWFKTSDAGATLRGIIQITGGAANGGLFCDIGMNVSKKFYGRMNGGVPDSSINSGITVNDGAWHFGAMSRVSGVTRLFLDNDHVGTMFNNVNHESDTPNDGIRWGSVSSAVSSQSWNGDLDEGIITVGWGVAPEDYAIPDAEFARS